jgi:hypothetical protein
MVERFFVQGQEIFCVKSATSTGSGSTVPEFNHSTGVSRYV